MKKNKQKRSLMFRFKDCIPKFHLVSLINFILGLALNPIMVNVLDVFNLRIWVHITQLQHYQKRKLNQTAVSLAIIWDFVAIHHRLTVLLY